MEENPEREYRDCDPRAEVKRVYSEALAAGWDKADLVRLVDFLQGGKIVRVEWSRIVAEYDYDGGPLVRFSNPLPYPDANWHGLVQERPLRLLFHELSERVRAEKRQKKERARTNKASAATQAGEDFRTRPSVLDAPGGGLFE